MKVKVLFFNYILVPSMRIYLYFPVIVFGKLFKNHRFYIILNFYVITTNGIDPYSKHLTV